MLTRSGAVGRVRISTRGEYRIKDMETGRVTGGEGPVLILVVNEKLLRQGW